MNNALISLLHITDPTLPIGGFSHSAGLETYVQEGLVKDAATVKKFVQQMLVQNLQFTDASILSLTYQATLQNDFEKIMELDKLSTAVKLPSETRQASNKLGLRLLKIFQPLLENIWCDKYSAAIKNKSLDGHYCIAFALCAAAMKINLQETLTGFFYNAAVGFVTNAVKLVPLSQQSGQKILLDLHGLIEELATQTMAPCEERIGLCCNGFDIRSMEHERLYSRLYMS